MQMICIDAGDAVGMGNALLTHGKVYSCSHTVGGYYHVLCDDGRWYTKLKLRFMRA